jgi:hypothetical protein
MLLTKPLCRYGADWLQMWGANPEITEPDRSVAYIACSLVQKYLQTGTKISGRPQTCGQSAAASWPDLLCQGNAPALPGQKCLLYWYKSTVTDMLYAFVKVGDTLSRLAGTQFTCFTGKKVQILTD